MTTAPPGPAAPALTVGEGLERHVLGGLLAATIATHLLVARNGLLPVQRPTTFALEFWKWLLLAHVAVALGAFVVLWLPWRIAGRFRVARLVLFLEAAGFVALVALLNRNAVVAAVQGDGGPAWWASLGSLAAATLGLGMIAVQRAGRRWPLRVAAVVALSSAILAFRPGAPPAPPPALATPGVTPPLVVVGLDGADWTYMDPLIARGFLPTLAKLRAGGAWGRLETIQPTLSPAIWTTAVTGRTPRRHGIRGFTATRIGAIGDTLPSLRPLRGILFEPVMDALRARRYVRERPISSADRRAPAFWNIATAYKLPVDVVDWWATAPAEPVLGAVVSDRFYFEALVAKGGGLPAGLTHPPELAGEVARLVVLPDQVTLEQARPFVDATPAEFERMRVVRHPSPLTGIAHELTYFIGVFETDRRIARHLIERSRRRFGRPANLFVLFRIIDKTGHTALQFSSLVPDHAGARPEEVAKFGEVATAAYRAADRALGEIVGAMGEANVVVLSDHGFQLEGEGDERAYNHREAPPGIFIGYGPAFTPGRLEKVSVYDVFPLLAYLKGLPVADDLPGAMPVAALDPAGLAARPMLRTAGYADDLRRAVDAGSDAADAEMLERLRALGYLK